MRNQSGRTKLERNVNTYELNKSLVSISPNVAFSVDDLPKWLAELDELLVNALPWQIPQVQHLRRRLRVAKLRLPRGRRHPLLDLGLGLSTRFLLLRSPGTRRPIGDGELGLGF